MERTEAPQFPSWRNIPDFTHCLGKNRLKQHPVGNLCLPSISVLLFGHRNIVDD